MSVTIHPVTPEFVAEVGDVDLAQPLGADDLAAIRSAYSTYSVLVFPDQHLAPDEHLAFARNFGPLEGAGGAYGGRRKEASRIRPELGDASNLDTGDKIWDKNSRLRMLKHHGPSLRSWTKVFPDPKVSAPSQVAMYCHGVGDNSWIPTERVLGGALGAGLTTRLRLGYTFISQYYCRRTNILAI